MRGSKNMKASKSVAERVRGWATRLHADALLLWVAARHRDVPLVAKAIAFFVAAYAFSPVDLIPDVIPVLGLLDDLIIVPLGVWAALALIPERLRAGLRAEAEALAARPVSRTGLLMVFLLWVAIGVAVWAAIRGA